MTKRQKRLCRALLDFYDASGAQPCLLAQLARKTGYAASDIYDKDSQSGDLWPFDPKARGNYAGMLSFSSGKNTTVSITSVGLIELEKQCADEPSSGAPANKSVEPAKAAPAPAEIRKRTGHSTPAVPATPPPAPTKAAVATAPTRKVPALAKKQFTSDEVADARMEFALWLRGDPAGMSLIEKLEGQELIEAALEKFFSEFLRGKDI